MPMAYGSRCVKYTEADATVARKVFAASMASNNPTDMELVVLTVVVEEKETNATKATAITTMAGGNYSR